MGVKTLGLIPKSRLYVYLSLDIDTAKKVGSGRGICKRKISVTGRGRKIVKG